MEYYECETQQFSVDDDDTSDAPILWGRLLPMNSAGAAAMELEDSKDCYTIGRRDDVDLRVNGGFVSSQHCRVYRINDGHDDSIMIEDLSSNGTTRKHYSSTAWKSVWVLCREKAQNLKLSPFEQKYDVLHELGRGNFAVVKLAVDKTSGTKVAVKIIDKRRHMMNSKLLSGFTREVGA
ncbi:hypothetical protein HK405_002796 [Cladochytrium tenue]|nr:hypothetical protein HK405_002796 [Cladochytrium tenue]